MNFFYLEQVQNIWTHPSNKGSQLQAIKRSLKWWLFDRKLSTPIEVETFGYKLLLYPDSFRTRGVIYYTPLHDYDSMQFVQRYLRPGDNFIDVGANIGEYTLLACSVIGEEGHVSSFEPAPQTVNRLKENIVRNQLNQVKVYPVALGEKNSLVDFTVIEDAVSHITASNDSPQSHRIQVPCHRLEDVLEQRPYAMAKIDVEGVELSVLKGAETFLSNNNPPVLILEINGGFERYGLSPKDILQYLDKLGYSSALYHADTNKLTFTTEVWGDVLFISRSSIGDVLKRIQARN